MCGTARLSGEVVVADLALFGARSTLSQDVYRELLGRITERSYGPGERLVETRIAKEFGVSQGVVREALRQLQVHGLVEYEPHRGCHVRAVDQQEVDEICQVRAVLEALAARLAARRGIDTAALMTEVEIGDELVASGDTRAWAAHAFRFHRLIVAASGNRMLLTTWDGLHIEARITQLTLGPNFDLVATNDGHRAITDALASRDEDLAARLSCDHWM
jgi:DNA-binding GntR family transcriptional regulator